MKEFETCQYKVFDYFKKGLTLVTAGNVKDFSTCTIGWGTMGTLWSGAGINSVITVFVHPSRYTCGYLKGNERFTVSFFPSSTATPCAIWAPIRDGTVTKSPLRGLLPCLLAKASPSSRRKRSFCVARCIRAPSARRGLPRTCAVTTLKVRCPSLPKTECGSRTACSWDRYAT